VRQPRACDPVAVPGPGTGVVPMPAPARGQDSTASTTFSPPSFSALTTAS
jgi:hypothetical protein